MFSKTLDSRAVAELDYEVDAPYPRKIDIRTFADGGVTVTIPWRPYRLQMVLLVPLTIGLILGVMMLWGGSFTFDRILRALGYVLAPPVMIFMSFLLFGWRNNDATEIIAMGPKAVHLKPPNGWAVNIARSDLNSIKLHHRTPSSSTCVEWSIWLEFEHHGIRRVCVGRPEEDVRAVAAALQKAFEATQNPKPPQNSLL